MAWACSLALIVCSPGIQLNVTSLPASQLADPTLRHTLTSTDRIIQFRRRVDEGRILLIHAVAFFPVGIPNQQGRLQDCHRYKR